MITADTLPSRPLTPEEVRSIEDHKKVFECRGRFDGRLKFHLHEPCIQLVIELQSEPSEPLTAVALSLDVSDSGDVSWVKVGEFRSYEFAEEPLDEFAEPLELIRDLQEAGAL